MKLYCPALKQMRGLVVRGQSFTAGLFVIQGQIFARYIYCLYLCIMRRLSKEEMTRVYIGCLVQEKMAELGLNNTTAGELAGITRKQVGWIISGIKDITLPTLFKLQWALKLDLDLNLKKILEFNKFISQ